MSVCPCAFPSALLEDPDLVCESTSGAKTKNRVQRAAKKAVVPKEGELPCSLATVY